MIWRKLAQTKSKRVALRYGCNDEALFIAEMTVDGVHVTTVPFMLNDCLRAGHQVYVYGEYDAVAGCSTEGHEWSVKL